MSEKQPQPRKISVPLLIIIMITLMAIVAMVTIALNNRNEATDDDALVIVDRSAQSDGVKNVEPPTPITDFTMLNVNGDPTPFSSFQGQWVLLYFGYTYCPDFCPTTMLDFRQIQNKLASDALLYMMISVDYERDTPEVLETYLKHFNDDFIGLTGDTIDSAIGSFGVFYEKRENPNSPYYTVDHTASTFLVNPQGELVAVYAYSTPVDTIVADLKTKLSAS